MAISESLTWKAVQAAVEYSKTEDGAQDAEARLLALRVANGLMRTELAILKHQDDAFVDALLEELGVDAGWTGEENSKPFKEWAGNLKGKQRHKTRM